MVQSSQSRFTLLAADRPSAAAALLTSPRQTRVGGSRCRASGRLSRRRRSRSMFTPGSRACGYRTASGRAKWLNRDPLGEPGFELGRRNMALEHGSIIPVKAELLEGPNLYTFLSNRPGDDTDAFGLYDTTLCTLAKDCRKRYDKCLAHSFIICGIIGIAQPELYIPCMVSLGASCTADFKKCLDGL